MMQVRSWGAPYRFGVDGLPSSPNETPLLLMNRVTPRTDYVVEEG